jgi:hypothetical protein
MLLSINADAKTIKGNAMGYLTGVLYLAPYNLSGRQVCPKASAGCAAACLNTAGRGVYSNVQDSRIAKTNRFFANRRQFMADLVKDVEALIRKAAREGMIPVVRLNGTSDIPFEKFPVERDGVTYPSIMEAFSDVAFYDYTAILGRKKAIKLPNYHLTFSLKEDNDVEAIEALRQGYNVSVVMNIKRKEAKPNVWGGYPVIDGDETDLRFLDPNGGHIVALFAKGKAAKDTSGFVRSPGDGFVTLTAMAA